MESCSTLGENSLGCRGCWPVLSSSQSSGGARGPGHPSPDGANTASHPLRSAQSPNPSQRGWEGNRSAQSDWNKELWDLTVPLFSLSHFLSLEHLPALFLVTATICLESTEGPFPREERIKSAQPPQQETRLPFWCTKDIRKSLYISSRSKPAHLLLTPEC